MRRSSILFFLILALGPGISQASWWSKDWNYRKEIKFDLTPAGANIPGTVSDVPVLIRLHFGNFTYFKDTKPDGGDLRFVAGDDKTPLKFHIERYDPGSQLGFIWVQVPRLAGGTNTDKIYMYYGNSSATAASDPAGTYDVNQVLVYHFSESKPPPVDATAFGNKPKAATVEFAPALIGGGAKFSADSSISVPASASLRLVPAQGFTINGWIRIAAAQSDAVVFALEDGARSLVLGINGAQAYARLQGPGVQALASANASLSLNEWHQVALEVGAGKLSLYIDGASVATAAAAVPEIAGGLTIGANAAGGRHFIGDMDEVEASDVARGAEWIRLIDQNQGMNAKLVVFGNDSQREAEKVSYFRVTLQNVTPDGWAVISVLAAMFVIAMLIMFSKAVYLARVHRANALFLREFAKLRGDPTALDRPETGEEEDALDMSPFLPASAEDKENKFRMSTIFRLYHVGIHEMRRRVGGSAGAVAVKALSAQSIEAMRAALDASQVRLTQRLSSQMVLLTIAIAGGPFLGLLGTVVGVMITFAAIAATGDVNVNSIAPGIAAALVATVAGLAVAIPSLFGYNWLNTRIKNITADMRVFVDEFITRIAEHYS
ncbi:MAG: DUF2341 domain-containing protein [Gammaproteobacteria bacterium]|nr:DUF2341 domain-containing protein [Gammaproteobacteria bacterium]MDE2348525.1 DUF2341 domain-containing protein [Gammaproteobacteria bacterium]